MFTVLASKVKDGLTTKRAWSGVNLNRWFELAKHKLYRTNCNCFHSSGCVEKCLAHLSCSTNHNRKRFYYSGLLFKFTPCCFCRPLVFFASLWVPTAIYSVLDTGQLREHIFRGFCLFLKKKTYPRILVLAQIIWHLST